MVQQLKKKTSQNWFLYCQVLAKGKCINSKLGNSVWKGLGSSHDQSCSLIYILGQGNYFHIASLSLSMRSIIYTPLNKGFIIILLLCHFLVFGLVFGQFLKKNPASSESHTDHIRRVGTRKTKYDSTVQHKLIFCTFS